MPGLLPAWSQPRRRILQVTSVVTQPVAYSGENTTVTWTVANFGAPVWTGTQFWYDDVWISPDPTFIASRATLLGLYTHKATAPLGTGSSYTTSQVVTLPAGTSATRSIH